LKRVKRRYLALQLEMEGLPTEKEFMDAIWGAVGKLYGEFGASLTSLALINLDAERKVAVVRTSLETLDFVRASLASLTSVAGREASVHVLAVSGTIKALFEKL
jgi:ribonuclease P/MRP protein subunit POP5